MRHPDPRRGTRLAAHAAAAEALARLSDRRLAALVEGAAAAGTGIGGSAAELTVDGVRVFAKRVPLTDLERRPEHARSTANLFGLPVHYHYGVGSAGFGAWRELAVHAMTTRWVLSGAHPGFPLMYHWRVLPLAPAGDLGGFTDVAGAVEFWEGSPAVRRRIEAVGAATASVVLFLEHIPWTLRAWLAGGTAAAADLARVERDLLAGTAFLRSRGVVHFDAHFDNVLTDGAALYFADFGLAADSGFALAPEEAEFVARHRDYDHGLVVSQLLRHMHGDGADPAAGPGAAIAARHAPVAAVIDRFHRRLLSEGRRVPYPGAEVGRLCAAAGGAR